MPGSAGKAPEAPALVMRISVPAEGSLRAVAAELAARIAEYLGTQKPQAASVGASIDGMVSRVAHGGADVTLEFRETDRELVIHARCDGRSTEARHKL
jgi:hypothetical protein